MVHGFWDSGTARARGRLEGWVPGSDQLMRKIDPNRVSFFDEIDLPLSPPAFDLLLTPDSERHLIEAFKPNQISAGIGLGEPRPNTAFVLANARGQIGAIPCIDRAILSVGHNISGDEIEPSHAGTVQGLLRASISQHLNTFVFAIADLPQALCPAGLGNPSRRLEA